MSDEIRSWFFRKWPDGLKIAAAITGIGGALLTIFSLGGTVTTWWHAHDATIRSKVLADQAVIDRNNQIDQTLKYHGQEIWTIDKKLDAIGEKIDKLSDHK